MTMQKELRSLLDKAFVTSHNSYNERGLSEFEAVISAISGFNDPNVIGPLILLIEGPDFSDEAAFSIIHYVEIFDDELYINRIIEILDNFYKKSPYWCCVVILRIINNSSSLKELKNQIQISTNAIKQVFANVCRDILKRFPVASSKVNDVLKFTV